MAFRMDLCDGKGLGQLLSPPMSPLNSFNVAPSFKVVFVCIHYLLYDRLFFW